MEVMQFVNPGHYTAMTMSFQNLLQEENGYLSDVCLVAEEKKFPCHKVILSSLCPYFYTMFHSTLKESTEKEIKIHGVNENVMEALIRYIYLGKIDINVNIAQGILIVSDMMNITELKNACSQFFVKNIDSANCLGLWNLGRQVNTKGLENTAWTYALSHFTEVRYSEEFINLSFEDMSQYIKDPLLNISQESDAVDAILKWLSNGNQKHTREIFSFLHMNQLDKHYLCEVLLNNPIVSACCKTKHFINQILNSGNCRDLLCYLNLEPRIFTGLQKGIFVLGNSRTMNVINNKTENVCLTMRTNQPDIVCNSIDIPVPLLQQNNDELLDSVACCSFDNMVYVSGFQGREDQLWKYDPLYKVWTYSTIFLSYRSFHCLVAKDKETLYAVGGMDPYLDIFDEQIEELTLTKDHSTEVGSLHVPVKWGGCVIYDNKIILFGGESWNYTYYHPEATDVIQMFDTITKQTVVLHTRLISPTDVARVVVHKEKIILMDSDSTWILDIGELLLNQRNTVVDQIVKPGSDSIYFGLELVNDILYVVAGESGLDSETTDVKVVKFAHVEQFLNKEKEVEWKFLGELKEPLKVCATCQVKIKIS